MKDNPFLKALFFLGRRTIILYLLAFGLVSVLFNIPKVKQTVHLKILNRFRPESFDYLVQTYRDGKAFDQKKLEAYAFYYQKVTEYIPNRADAYGLLGFCYYHLDKKKEAIAAYEKAIEMNPNFFWFRYNLSMIYFKAGQYKEAYEVLKKAVKTSPQATLKYIQWSKRIYVPLIVIQIRLGYSVEKDLKNGYRECYKRLAMLQQFFFNRPEFKALFEKMESKLHLF